MVVRSTRQALLSTTFGCFQLFLGHVVDDDFNADNVLAIEEGAVVGATCELVADGEAFNRNHQVLGNQCRQLLQADVVGRRCSSCSCLLVTPKDVINRPTECYYGGLNAFNTR